MDITAWEKKQRSGKDSNEVGLIILDPVVRERHEDWLVKISLTEKNDT